MQVTLVILIQTIKKGDRWGVITEAITRVIAKLMQLSLDFLIQKIWKEKRREAIKNLSLIRAKTVLK